MMRLTFLGTGTSTGVPQLGCTCPACSSADPRDSRLRTSAMLDCGEGRHLLFDAGPDLRTQLLLYARGIRPDALLVTHSHYDHVGGVDDLRPFCQPDGFDVYCQKEADEALRRAVPYCYAKDPYPGAPVLHNHIIDPERPFSVSGIEVTPLPVNHYLLDIVGFRIGPLAYVTDAKTIPESTIEKMRGCRTLVINALRHTEHISHLNLSEALDVIKLVKPQKAWLTHISHQLGPHAEASAMLPEGVSLAYDGLTIEV